ncbi:MAG: hypothetical protein ACFKPT_30310 [Gloeotrichia echinulata GP01]
MDRVFGNGHEEEFTNALYPMSQAMGRTTSTTHKGMEFPVAFNK